MAIRHLIIYVPSPQTTKKPNGFSRYHYFYFNVGLRLGVPAGIDSGGTLNKVNTVILQ